MKLSVITPTGDRPEAFRLCELWMSRQTRKPDEWIVIDDGWAPIEAEFSIATQVIRPRELWSKENTQAKNLLIGLAAATGDVIAFIEDDDFYHPDYLLHLSHVIEVGADIVGETRSLYYHLPTRQYLRNENMEHASLCQTMISRRMAGCFADLLQYNHSFYDCLLWQTANVRRNGWKGVLEASRDLCVGIKGMPGRKGIGSGHRPNAQYWHSDPELKTLIELLGEDARHYLPFTRLSTEAA